MTFIRESYLQARAKRLCDDDSDDDNDVRTRMLELEYVFYKPNTDGRTRKQVHATVGTWILIAWTSTMTDTSRMKYKYINVWPTTYCVRLQSTSISTEPHV